MRQTFKELQNYLGSRWQDQSMPAVLIIVSGATLRLIGIGSRPMWYDEAIAVLVSRTGVSSILRSILSPSIGAAANIHPPLYFSTLWAWMAVFGDSPFAARLLSLVFSLVVLFVLWQIAKMLVDQRLSLFVVGLYAFSPFQVHYGQEARMYVMMSVFLLIATWALLRLLDEGKTFHLIVLGAASALAMYTQVLSSVYLICLYLLPVFLRRWDHLKRVIFAGLLALVIYTPWLLQLPGQINKVRAGYWVARPGILELIQTLIAFNSGLPLTGIWLPAGLALTVLLIILLVWRSFRLVKADKEKATLLLSVIFLAFGPVVLLFAVSQLWPVYIIRGLLTSGVVFLVWIALILSEADIKPIDRGVIFGVVVVSFAIGLFNHYQYRGFPYAPFREIDNHLASNLREGGVVIHSNKITMLPAYYYDPELPHHFIQDSPGSGSDTLALPTQEVIGVRADEDIEGAAADHSQIFFVVFTQEIQEYERSGAALHPALDYLYSKFTQVQLESFDDVYVYEFQELQ